MIYDFVVLGADGQIGILACRYLLKHGYRILASDLFSENVRREIKDLPPSDFFTFRRCDHRYTQAIESVIRAGGCPTVINCADDFYNDNVFDACLLTGVNHVDMGSELNATRRRQRRHKQFKRAGLTAIQGCGSVPGIGGVMLRHLSRRFSRMVRVESGFAWDSNQKTFVSPFFLFVVLYEMSEPAYVLENGQLRKVAPKSIKRTRNFAGVGKQTVYAAPHPEVFTYKHYFPEIQSCTFFAGFPEHTMKVIDALNAVGLNYNKPVWCVGESGEFAIHPSDFLSVICKMQRFPDGYEETENLWTEVWGRANGKRVHHKMECLVPPIDGYAKYGCNIDTAFPGCVLAEMVKDGQITEHGVFATESNCIPTALFLERMVDLGFSFRIDNQPCLNFDTYEQNQNGSTPTAKHRHPSHRRVDTSRVQPAPNDRGASRTPESELAAVRVC